MISTKKALRLGASWAALALCIGLAAAPASAKDVRLWQRQIGTAGNDAAYGLALSSEGDVSLYVVGYTSGLLFDSDARPPDGWIVKYDSDGRLLWKKQLGSAAEDYAVAVADDAVGNVYVGGQTYGSFAGPSFGKVDSWIIKYDSDGNELWRRQVGSDGFDRVSALTVDGAGHAFMVGSTDSSFDGPPRDADDSDGWIVKFDTDGNELWRRQVATYQPDALLGAAADKAGNLYVSGYGGSFAAPSRTASDAWLIKYDPSGTMLWARQVGTTSDDEFSGVAIDADGDVFTIGTTRGAFAGRLRGGTDIIATKYGSDGRQLWRRQFGTPNYDTGYGLTTSAEGDVYLVGEVPSLVSSPTRGAQNVWIMKCDRGGHILWRRLFGTSKGDRPAGAAVDLAGDIYLAGQTVGALAGPSRGGSDAWVMKYRADPSQ